VISLNIKKNIFLQLNNNLKPLRKKPRFDAAATNYSSSKNYGKVYGNKEIINEIIKLEKLHIFLLIVILFNHC
jgi:hypothetical protein